jgi:hypothetical protein
MSLDGKILDIYHKNRVNGYLYRCIGYEFTFSYKQSRWKACWQGNI